MSAENTTKEMPPVHGGVAMLPFLDKQYEDLRRMLLAASAEERQMEKIALASFGVFYSWLSTQPQRGAIFSVFISSIPCVITYLAILRMEALTSGMGTIARYLCSIEEHLRSLVGPAYDGPPGWETFLSGELKYVKRFHNSHYWFWYSLLAGTVVASLLFTFYWPENVK